MDSIFDCIIVEKEEVVRRLLYHVSDFKVDVLIPEEYDERAICLSEGTFAGCMGQWLYIFDFDLLHHNFDVEMRPSGRIGVSVMTSDVEHCFRGDPLGVEYRIHKPIDVDRFAFGVAQNFEVCKGVT